MSEVAAMVRELTDEEVAFYLEHGWVKVPSLVTHELAGALRQVMESLADLNYLATRPEAEPFGEFVFSEAMRRNAVRLADRSRLTDRDVPMQCGWDVGVFKPHTPAGSPLRSRPEMLGGAYHQDSPEHGSDRVGEMQWWLALAEVTADMGPMRFVDGSHREGPLGSVFNEDGGGDLLELYPRLAARLTPPMEYRPGDATVHIGHMVHGSLPNLTDRTRISYIFQYIPADTRYWEGQGPENQNPGSQRRPLNDVRYPTLEPRETGHAGLEQHP